EELETILRQVVGVRDVLRKMCQVSVTRTSLREAVREALLPILREHRDELFPELAEIQKRLDAVEAYEAVHGAPAAAADRPASDGAAPDAFRREFFERLAGFESRIEQLAAIEARHQAIEASHQAIEERTKKLSDALDVRATRDELGGLETRIREDLEERTESLSAALENRATREELGGLETRLREDLEERVESLSAALEDRATREELGSLETRVRGDLEERDEKLGSEIREEVARGLAELETRREARLVEMREKLDEELRSSVMSVEEKIERVRSYLEDIQTSIPETARAAAGEVESRLREEIESMVVQLSERLNEVRELLEKVDREVAPGRTLLESLDTRLERLEKALHAVSERVEGIDNVTPEIRAIGTRFAEIRKQVEDATRTLETASGDVRLTLGTRLDDLRRALEEAKIGSAH